MYSPPLYKTHTFTLHLSPFNHQERRYAARKRLHGRVSVAIDRHMRRPLKFESLEEKKLLAADISLTSEGELQIIGTEANDRVVVQYSGDSVRVTANGEKLAFAKDEVNSLYFEGGAGDDFFVNKTSLDSLGYGNRGDDRLVGGKGSDRFYGGPDDDRLFGSDGDDNLHGDYGDDRLYGGNGNDSLHGWYGADLLLGQDGDDYLSGYKGNDELNGGDGDDMLKGHEGDDRLFGEDGNDRLYGWKGDDLLVGGNGNDALSAWSGHDILVGGNGNDLLKGHSGNDLIIGGRGADRIDGGTGDDFVITGYTKIDHRYDELDLILADWNSLDDTHERFEQQKSFIYSSDVKYNDFAVDLIYDTNVELDLFIRDGFDKFANA